ERGGASPRSWTQAGRAERGSGKHESAERQQDGSSDQALQHASALHDILVVPLNQAGLLEPALERSHVDLLYPRKAHLCGFELAFRFEVRLLERLPAPKHQIDAALAFGVTHDRIPVEKPNRVRMPDFALRLREALADFSGKQVADLLLVRRLGVVVSANVRSHRDEPCV